MIAKKIKFLGKTLALTAIFGSSAFAAQGDILTEADINKLKSDYPELIGKPGINVKKGIDQGQFKQIELEVVGPKGPQQFEVFVVNNVKAIFAGNAYNENGAKFNLPINEAAIKEGIGFKIGNGPEVVYLVTDPECPYCQELEKKMSKEMYSKYTINIIPMPLSFHKNAKPMLNWILAGKDEKEKGERLHAVMAKGDKSYETYTPTKEELAKNEALFEKGYKAANELKATGTPSIFNDKFEKTELTLPINEVAIKEGVGIKIGTGPKNVYIVTDPECPYCQTLEKNLADDVYSKYTINIIPMPLSFHNNAKPMLNWILAAKNEKEKGERLHAVMAKGDKSYETYTPSQEELAKNEALFEKASKAAIMLKASGTPTVYDDKFQKVDYGFLLKPQQAPVAR